MTKDDGRGTKTSFIYDNNQIIAEYDSSGTLLRKYVYNPQRIDEPVEGLSPQGTVPEWYYHFDGLGSVINLTDSSGAIIEEYEYDPFGETTILDPTTHSIRTTSQYNNRFLFTARELDSESGLYYYRNRYYDSAIGRFISADPIGYVGGINLYTYCNNNSINWIDPLGLLWRIDPRWKQVYNEAKKRLEETYKEAQEATGKEPATIHGKSPSESIDILAEAIADEMTNPETIKALLGTLTDEDFNKLLERIEDKHPDWPWEEWEKMKEEFDKKKASA